MLCAVDSSGGAERAMKQKSFALAAWDKKGKVTRRERFLANGPSSSRSSNFN